MHAPPLRDGAVIGRGTEPVAGALSPGVEPYAAAARATRGLGFVVVVTYPGPGRWPTSEGNGDAVRLEVPRGEPIKGMATRVGRRSKVSRVRLAASIGRCATASVSQGSSARMASS